MQKAMREIFYFIFQEKTSKEMKQNLYDMKSSLGWKFRHL